MSSGHFPREDGKKDESKPKISLFGCVLLFGFFSIAVVDLLFGFSRFFWFSGVFVTEGDVGVGTIVGSAVFNILVIIGICGIFAGQVHAPPDFREGNEEILSKNSQI